MQQPPRIPTFEEVAASRDEITLHEFAEWFFARYSPDDPREKARFHADLFTLVQRVHAHAQAPLIKQMSAAMSLVPLPQLLPNTPAGTRGKASG